MGNGTEPPPHQFHRADVRCDDHRLVAPPQRSSAETTWQFPMPLRLCMFWAYEHHGGRHSPCSLGRNLSRYTSRHLCGSGLSASAGDSGRKFCVRVGQVVRRGDQRVPALWSETPQGAFRHNRADARTVARQRKGVEKSLFTRMLSATRRSRCRRSRRYGRGARAKTFASPGADDRVRRFERPLGVRQRGEKAVQGAYQIPAGPEWFRGRDAVLDAGTRTALGTSLPSFAICCDRRTRV